MELEELRLNALLSGAGLLPMPDVGAPLPMPSVEAGQMWRARWDDVVTTVFVDSLVGGFRNEVRVAPITFGADGADDRAIVLPIDATSLSVELSVWPELVTDIAEIVLEQWIANIEQFRSLEALQQAAISGRVQYGLPILNAAGERNRNKRVLSLVMEALASAARVVSGSGGLPDLLLAAGVSVSLLARKLNVPTSFALGLAQGTASVDLAQARTLAEDFGLQPVDVLRANPAVSGDLVQAVTRGHIGPAVRLLAREDDQSFDEVLVGISQGALALAARGEGPDSLWIARVDYYLTMRLGDWE